MTGVSLYLSCCYCSHVVTGSTAYMRLVCLQECISQSAVETKFQQHTTNGKQIVKELYSMMETIFESALSQR